MPSTLLNDRLVFLRDSRLYWARYFQSQDIPFLFFSAIADQAEIDALLAEELGSFSLSRTLFVRVRVAQRNN